MKKALQFLRKIIYYTYEKNGRFKVAIAVVIATILVIMYSVTGNAIWWQIALVPGIYVGSFAAMGIIYAWVIWPIKSIIEWIKKKKSEKE